jgi:outer membrane protein assembly factor BamB
MNQEHDDLIKRALTPPEYLSVPMALRDGIGSTIRVTPQERSEAGVTLRKWVGGTAWPVFVAVLLMLAIAALLVGSELWHTPPVPMFRGGPSRTGVNPGPAPKGVPVVAWSAQLKTGAVPYTTQPVVGGGRVFIVDDSGFVTALDEHNGTQLWSVDLGDPILSSPMLVDNDLVVGSDDGGVVALDAVDGSQGWAFQTGGPVSGSLAFADGILYVPSEDGYLYALGVDGTERWRSANLGAPLNRGPAIVDGIVYQPTAGGGLVALRASDGTPIWRRDLSQTGVSTPSVIDGTVYVALGLLAPDEHRGLIAIAASDSLTRWTWSSQAGQQVAVAALDHGTVLVTAKGDGIVSLDPVTGEQRWMVNISANATVGGALVDGTLVTVGDDGSIAAIDAASGVTLWTASVEGNPGPPSVVDGRVIVATSFGMVFALGDQSAVPTPSGR